MATVAALMMGTGVAASASAAEPETSAESLSSLTLSEARAQAEEIIEVENPIGVVAEPGQLVVGTALDCWAYVPAGEQHGVGGCDTVPPYSVKVKADCVLATDKYSVAFRDNVRTYWTADCSQRARGASIVAA